MASASSRVHSCDSDSVVDYLSCYLPNLEDAKQLNAVNSEDSFKWGKNMEREQEEDPFVGNVVEQLRSDRAQRKIYVNENNVLYRIWRAQGALVRLLVIPGICSGRHLRWRMMIPHPAT